MVLSAARRWARRPAVAPGRHRGWSDGAPPLSGHNRCRSSVKRRPPLKLGAGLAVKLKLPTGLLSPTVSAVGKGGLDDSEGPWDRGAFGPCRDDLRRRQHPNASRNGTLHGGGCGLTFAGRYEIPQRSAEDKANLAHLDPADHTQKEGRC